MSVTFNKNSKFGSTTAEIEGAEKGGIPSAYNRRMSRRGSVLNNAAPAPPPGVLVNSDRAYSVVAETIPTFTDMHDEAREHTEKETSMGFFEGMRTYPKAAAWSVLLSSSIIMEGYDTNLLGSFFAFPQFNDQFGKPLPSGKYEVEAGWQAALMNGAMVGSFIGLALNGIMCDKIGYKKTFLFALILMIGAIFLPFFAKGVGLLMAGQVLSGIPW
jgi:SP family general alpha glucoside:H+ symporter-like MFS transporter